MDFLDIKIKDEKYISNTYNRANFDILYGSGASCYSSSGMEYIDFSSGIGVNSLGFADSRWVSAVKAQLDKLNHTSNLYYTKPQVELAEQLCALSGMKKVFFSNSGAEANEGAIKTARKYSHDKYGEQRSEIITLVNSFHGRTIATLSATGQDVFHKHFGPFVGGFVYAKPNDIQSLQSLVNKNTAAIMVECILGEGGVLPLEADFLEAVQQICSSKDILLIVDEVQTGAGRTGTFLCCEQYNITPDIITMAKGLGGGLPIGAVLFGEKTKDTLGLSDHGTTFGGNPIVAAGAKVVLDSIDADFLADVTAKGSVFLNRISGMPNVTAVTGKGLMLGIALKKPFIAADIIVECAENGLIILAAKEKLRLLPPLNISDEQINKGLTILEDVLTNL